MCLSAGCVWHKLQVLGTSIYKILTGRLSNQRLRCISAPSYLRLAVLLDPAEHAGRQLLEAAHRHRVAEGLEQRVHDTLKDVELELVGHLVLSLLGVVLVGPHNVLIVPAAERKRRSLAWFTVSGILIGFCYEKSRVKHLL